ncbi:heavy metal translocating P-type ATPase [Coprococcus catus]|uniref:heavy metal translocating P-type ATPase n=1 Tax=Coprococcus catus TaxID=116085 RepID=UPI001C8BB132|nr:heavy metal translocating P-type ATPase [Coprococcus catus]MBX9231017.1 heavy metal translocating P-type ATPase [Coprococcus catus]MCT6800027.1 heavy metal translocating P-type ATPase [Coprococcus catus]
MKFVVKHEIKGRIRVHFCQKRMTFEEADTLQYYLNSQEMITSSKVQERTQDATICYTGDRASVIALLRSFHYEKVDVPDVYRQNSGRATNREYWDKLVTKVVVHYGNKLFLPMPVRTVITGVKSIKYIYQGIHTLLQRRIEVPVLDATAIGVSMFRGDISTAGSVMFLLGIGEILEEWTHKKSVDDLARSMSLNISRVWLCNDGQEMLVPTTEVRTGDLVRVHMGNMIPFDGAVAEGEAMVNQASLTGESEPVRKYKESTVYAGTVVEEGELTIHVKETNGSSKFDKIVTMIEESEKLKSGLESKAEHLADRLVPYTLLGTGITYLLTRNVTKAISVLMVDFSCALKLAMPISVLSAIREASNYHVTVKGGRYLEAMAEADTIVFDKTGTLTKAQPTVKQVVAFNGMSENELLRIAACLEEHFPHSMAKAVVQAAVERRLVHEELHSKVEYIVAHGISSKINDKKVVIGSYHFVFEDEKCAVPDGMMEAFEKLPSECSHLFMAIDYELAAVICIEDPLREEAANVIRELKEAGISKVVMMTGDSDRTAKAIASRVGVDEYYSEVLPEDKASFVEAEKKAGRKVIMIGDGINDSPALSAADIGIAISDGAEIAREIADITVGADSLNELVTLKLISNGLMKRIHKNYRFIVSFNTGLILLGVAGILQPATSALLHNTSTLMIGLKSMQDIL